GGRRGGASGTIGARVRSDIVPAATSCCGVTRCLSAEAGRKGPEEGGPWAEPRPIVQQAAAQAVSRTQTSTAGSCHFIAHPRIDRRATPPGAAAPGGDA